MQWEVEWWAPDVEPEAKRDDVGAEPPGGLWSVKAAARTRSALPTSEQQTSLAERSGALASRYSLQGRGLEPHS